MNMLVVGGDKLMNMHVVGGDSRVGNDASEGIVCFASVA